MLRTRTGMRRIVRFAVTGIVAAVWALAGRVTVDACTAFCAAGDGKVLVGNNEDWFNPRSKLWFIPARSGSFGRMYVAFDDIWPAGGMNERGLWFDAFSTPPIGPGTSPKLPSFPGNIADAALSQCATVEEVVRLFNRFDRSFLAEATYMFADATGDAVSIERNAMVRKTGRTFIQTNFHQSLSRSVADGRFTTATAMLAQAGGEASVDLFRRILDATHQEGPGPTLYSNIYDLTSRKMHLYLFHDFTRVVTFDLAEELKKGERVLDIPALFPRNAAAEAFAARAAGPAGRVSGKAFAGGLLAVAALLVFGVGLGLWRGGRQIRIALAVVAGVIVVAGALVAIVAGLAPDRSSKWMRFSIGPPSGDSASVNDQMIRADGLTLKRAVSIAYGIPASRVIAPEWLAETRYSISATVGIDETESFKPMLQEELKRWLHLEAHLEVRPFDVFVLTGGDPSRLPATPGRRPSIWIRKEEAQFREASMDHVVSALQQILGTPVIDETGLRDSYNFTLAWTDDRTSSVTTVLRDRFGLTLTPSRRDMEALVVDQVRRDPALVLMSQAGGILRAAPPHVRERIARALTMY